MYFELRHLRTIRAIHEAGGLARAADLLNMTQSALSHQVKGLEDQAGVELFVRSGCDGIEHAGVGKGREGKGDALPDAVAGLGVGVDHRTKGVVPTHRRVRVGVEDGDGLGRCAGVEGPPEQLGRWAAVECGGVQQALECGAGLSLPEPTRLDASGAEAGGGGESVGADHRGERIVAAANG